VNFFSLGIGSRILYSHRYRDGNITINAQYEIDANHNNGLDFQYDAVVRNGRERKHLDGGDCECCRDVRVALICCGLS
jgi:hypothetical protein